MDDFKVTCEQQCTVCKKPFTAKIMFSDLSGTEHFKCKKCLDDEARATRFAEKKARLVNALRAHKLKKLADTTTQK